MSNQKTPLRNASLTIDQMQTAITKIDRRLIDLNNFIPSLIKEGDDPLIKALENKIKTLLLEIFGADTLQYQQYIEITDFDQTSYHMDTNLSDIREGVMKGILTAKAQLQIIKSGFEENLHDLVNSPSGKLNKSYEGLNLHKTIAEATSKLFHDEHYAEAVEKGVKALNNLIRQYSKIEDRDGIQLMEYVFSPKNPILSFNSLADQSDRDEQKGMMMLFSGAVMGLRNPRAHRTTEDDPEIALEMISFISLLAKLADRTIEK